jgi:hypothetical protein
MGPMRLNDRIDTLQSSEEKTRCAYTSTLKTLGKGRNSTEYRVGDRYANLNR